MTLGERIAAAIISVTMKLIALLPLPLSQAIGRGIGRLIGLLDTRAARVTRTNIELCLPELNGPERESLVRASLLHTGQMMMETPAAWLGDAKRIIRWIADVEGRNLIEEGMAAGKGVIVLLPHIGNWEMINVYLSMTGIKVTGLYHPPNQKYLQPLFTEIRGRFGNEIVPTSVKGIATLFRRLDEGKVVVVLPDQVPGRGEFAPFFGIEALTDKLIARLLARTEACVVNCVVKRLPDAQGFDVIFSEPHADIYAKDPNTALAGMNLSVEACMRIAPEQYQWEYKRFKERPAGELRLYNYDNDSSTYH